MSIRPQPAGPRAGPGLAPSLPLWLRAVLWCQALFWGAWWIGYLWLPEGILRGKLIAAQLPIDHLPFLPRTLAVIGYNLLWMLLFAVWANRVQVRRWPLGLTAVNAMWLIFGLLLGTNSFGVPRPAPLRPTLDGFLLRPGVMELSAYLLAAIATASTGRVNQLEWLSGWAERLEPSPLRRRDWLLLAVALLLLVTAAVREVISWCNVTGGC